MTKYMLLEKKDIETLMGWGYRENDLHQIQKAIYLTVYEKHKLEEPYDTVKHLTAAQAHRLLGNKAFLSGISRSAFHLSSDREYCKRFGVSFDSSTMFRPLENTDQLEGESFDEYAFRMHWLYENRPRVQLSAEEIAKRNKMVEEIVNLLISEKKGKNQALRNTAHDQTHNRTK